ncbi:collagen alpha-1(I) chain-like [Elephas maximus indicus]|uniref:collagen alpha-1(I) chain-like n=1 Tax=Elephas maximus indicus TaxID=99487 RepID=UPI002115EC5D|nr:collagen alpha-1(I) chain-like [Elephas maximus indicus]
MGRRRHGGRAIGPRLSRVTKAAGARPPAGAGGELTGINQVREERVRSGPFAPAGGRASESGPWRGAGRACVRARAQAAPPAPRGRGAGFSRGPPRRRGRGRWRPGARAAPARRNPTALTRERGPRWRPPGTRGAGGRPRPARPAGARRPSDARTGPGRREAAPGEPPPTGNSPPAGAGRGTTTGEPGSDTHWREARPRARSRRDAARPGQGGGGGDAGTGKAAVAAAAARRGIGPPRGRRRSLSPPAHRPPPAGNPHAHDGHTPPTRPARPGPGPGSEGASPGDTTGRGGPVATPNAARPVRGPRPGTACARPAGRGGADRRRRGRRCGGGPRHAHPPGPGAHRRESSRVRRWARTPAHRWRHGTGAGGRRHTTARGPSAGRTPGPTAPGARREGRTHTRTHGRARPRRQAAGPAKALPRLAGGRRGPRQAKGGARPHRGAGGPLPPHRAGRRGGSACEPRSVACAQDEGRRLGDPAPPRHPRRRLEKTFFTEDGPSPPIAPHVGPPPGARGRPGDGRGGACGIASPPHPASPEPGSGERAGPRGGVRALGRPAGGEEVRQSLTTDRRGPAAATQPGPPPRKGDFPRHRRKQHAGPPLLPLSLASRGSRHLRDGLERSRGTAKGPLEAHRHHLGGARGTPPPPTLAARPRTRADERGRAGFRAPAPLRTTGGRGGGARGPRAEREERSHSPRMSVPRLGAARTRPGRARQHHIDRVSAGTSEEEKTPRQGCQEAGEDSPGEDPLSASPAPPGLRKGGREDPAHGERLTREARGPGGGGAGHTLASTAATAGACDKGHAGQRARGARATPPSGTGDRGEAPRLDTWTRESRRTGPRRAAQAGRSGGGRGPSVDQRLRTRPGFPSAQRESPSEESVSAPIWWPKSSVLGERKATPRGGRGPLPTASPRNCGPAIGP